MNIIQIPLAKLHLSPANVRKNDSQLFIDELAANIGENGLLQNLVVAPIVKPKGHYCVTAGGRRLRAMNRLVELGQWPKDAAVDCRSLQGDAAQQSEVSFAENFMQLKMTVTDEIRAFKHFINEGSDVDAIARRLGLTRRHIEARLRLADLAEPIFAALDEGTITLDIAKAYASTASHERQLMVWEQMANHWQGNNADTIRRMIAHASLPSTSPIARYVGETAYCEAGGRIESDLFQAETGDKWLDSEIALRIAGEKLQAFAVEVATGIGYGWVRPLVGTRVDHAAVEALHPVQVEAAPLSDEEQARIADIADEMAKIEARFEEGLDDDSDADALEDRYSAFEAELTRIQDKPGIVPDELKPSVGCFVILNSEGNPVIDATLYSETAPRKQRSTTGAGGSANSSGEADGGGEDGEASVKPLSQRLIGELSVQRRDILAANLAVNPAVALDLLIFAIADRTPTYGRDERGTTIRAPEPSCYLDAYPASPAFEQLAEVRDGLDPSWTEHDTTVARFEAFAALDDDAKAGWLAYVVAKSLEPSIGGARVGHQGPNGNDLHDHLAGLMQIDAAQHWRPTAANYFDRVGKQQLLRHITDIGGTTMAASYMASKKGDLSQTCEKLFAGETIVAPEVKAAALAWVPDAIRFGASTEA
ncbi:MAG: ParB N-terminal domain-containing protein, partial [Sphingorhabdus sp.]|uniref:ParB/RepB/Spo0J family partition protein n=1 Tax=Sphingorhabdus sp. TaxID=1902408 RepID=UPI003CAF0826